MVAVILISAGACKSSDAVNNLIDSINPSSSPAPFALSSVVPQRTGPGAKVKLVGTGFQSGATVEIGGLTAQVLSVSSTEILVKTPDLPQGDASVKVVNPNGSESELSGNAVHISWVTLFDSGPGHSCAVIDHGEIQCWGDNTHGQLGNGVDLQGLDPNQGGPNAVIVNVPVKVLGITSGVTKLALGMSHTCAIVSGAAKCWGRATQGQLGNNPNLGGIANESAPVGVAGLGAGVADITTGSSHSCAVTTSGAAYCWGIGVSGELGDGENDFKYVPTAVVGMDSGVEKIASKASSWTCAIKDGAVYCWGINGLGLGDGTSIGVVTSYDQIGTIQSNVPVQVTGLDSGVTDLWVSSSNGCALQNGDVKCWGFNNYYQLANSSNEDAYYPKFASSLPSLPSILAMNTIAPCGLFSGGIKCWGSNGSGRLGSGLPESYIAQSPMEVSGLTSGVQSLVSGEASTCALKNGGLYCWGAGVLRGGSTSNYFTPVVPDIDW